MASYGYALGMDRLFTLSLTDISTLTSSEDNGGF